MSPRVGVCAAMLIWLGCAAAAAEPSASTPSGADAASVPPVKEITIDPNVKEPVCRLRAPTGSRIAKERCTTPGGVASNTEREQLRRDLDEMRSRAAMREQARAAAQLEALRRAGL